MSDVRPRRVPPRTLAGATILQIIPALREEPNARNAVDVARALLQSGARALVAAAEGPLLQELRAHGAEWIPLPNAGLSPFRLTRNARLLERLIAQERIDIVHAQSSGGAWSARMAKREIAVWLVTTLPDVPVNSGLGSILVSSLAHGDRVVTPSIYAAEALMARYEISPDQVTVIPRPIDTAAFDPLAVAPGRAADLRAAWKIPPGARIVLAPGRVAPWNGQIVLPDAARALVDAGRRDFVVVLAGDNYSRRRYARAVFKRARERGVADLFRLTGHCHDLPAAYAAADVVAVPALRAPVFGRVVAQAQAMARPVVTTNVGMLPEYVVAPPRMPADLRTGWVTRVGDPADFARALGLAFSLDDTDYQAMAARARQFADYMFSAHSVAVATRAVYTSLLAREA